MERESRYRDRRHAGRVLASKLERYANQAGVIVLALPRGGVPVGYEVALHLRAALDVFVVRKLGVPGDEELAMGAVASGGVRVLNDAVVEQLGVTESVVAEVTARELAELLRRERAYRGNLPPLDLTDRTVILVDDGLATGATMTAAILGVRQHAPHRIVVGVPIASPGICEEIGALVDDMTCAATPEGFSSVGAWYANFEQTTDAEVRALLDAARAAEQWQPPSMNAS
ncbi:MAG TPA: phosphoribosyltransferase [Polyangiaceae bacterium]|nr:phosphoribosyltransferase [Polyangiaceae bacterium]